MMAIRVYPGTETPRLMSRTSNVRKGEWDLVRGNHQGQRQLPRDQQAGHKTVPDQGMPKRQKALATQEPSTQDISLGLVFRRHLWEIDFYLCLEVFQKNLFVAFP